MLKEKIKGYIEKIRKIEGVLGCVLISRDGIMLGRSMEGEFNEPWLAAMCATLFASAESASGILKMAPPEAVSVMIEDRSVIVIGAGEKLLIVAMIRDGGERSALFQALADLAREIGGSF
ncbi:MAG: roadblock/LC7 domain-containing protein [Methanolinea sp.]|jgi:hypothetical protein|nr:roadblock/LC7 domain-containing protein [Methanolinea sp.]